MRGTRVATLHVRSRIEQTCLAGEVQLNGLNTNVLRTGSHLWCCCEAWWEGKGKLLRG